MHKLPRKRNARPRGTWVPYYNVMVEEYVQQSFKKSWVDLQINLYRKRVNAATSRRKMRRYQQALFYYRCLELLYPK